MDAISNLTVVFKAETNSFSSSVKGLGSAFSDIVKSTKGLASEGTVNAGQLQKGMVGVGNAMWSVAGVAALAGAGIAVGIGVKAVKAAGDFQQSMTQLVTSAGETHANLQKVSDGILNLAVSTGTSTEQLASGMFMVESSGQHGAAGLQVLKAAAQGARAEGANLETVTNALTTEMTDYHLSASQSTSAMNGLIAASAAGKMHLEDLASSMGSVLPLASSLGISFPQVAGAIAVMTNAGMSAQNASQNLANAIRSLATPNSIAVKSMKEVGLTAQQLKDTMSQQGLTGAISLIEQHVGKTFPSGSVQAVTAFKNLMGGATGYNVALMLGGKNMDVYRNNVSSISKAMASGKGDVEGWSEVQNNWNFKVAQAHEVVQTLFIRIGQQLLPVVGKLMDQVLPLVVGFSDWAVKSGALQNTIGFLAGAISNIITVGSGLVSFFQHNQVAMAALQGVLVAVAGAIVASMVVAFYAWATAAGAAAIATLAATWPILAIGAVIALVVAGIILAVQHWGDISKWLQGAWGATGAWFHSFFGGLGTWFQGVWGALGAWWHGFWAGIQSFFASAIHAVVGSVQANWPLLLGIFLGPFGSMLGYTIRFWPQIQGFINSGMNAIRNILSSIGATLYNIFIQPFVNAYNYISGVIGNIQNMIGNVINLGSSIGSTLHNAGIPGFAGGVQNFSGGWAVVGEHGPELVNLPRGSSVYPNALPSSMMPTSSQQPYPIVPMSPLQGNSGGGTQSREQHIHVYIGNDEIAHYVADKQAKTTRLRTGRRFTA